MITGIANEQERCLELRNCINALPEKHRDCLEFLMFHLVRVSHKESINKMTTKNLAVVFAPTILRHKSLDREIQDFQAKNDALEFMIARSESIFNVHDD